MVITENEPNIKIVAVMSLDGFIFLILFLLSSFILYKVYKLFRYKDPPVLLSIICITLSLATLVVYCSIIIIQQYGKGSGSFLNSDAGY